uniref:uncharacterized protein n=1 Tax=Pristiophorus japonicus TaxID=55135 RepID=UPI00398E8F58
MGTCRIDQYHQDNRCCNMCQRGHYKKEHCNQRQQTQCLPCKPDEFMDFLNYMNNCIRCDFCEPGSNLEMVASCTKTTNTRCRCKSDYYCSSHLNNKCQRCTKISSCGPGEGVSKKATLMTDTKCETCSSGSFSNVTDTVSPCQNHTKCALSGQLTLSPGTGLTDTKCTALPPTRRSATPWAVTTTPHIPSATSDWIVPVVISSGIFLAAVYIIIASLYLSRKRRVTINRVEHHTTEMMDELLQLRVVNFVMEKSEEVVECVVGFRGHGVPGLEDKPKETAPLNGDAGGYSPHQESKLSLYTEVIKGRTPSISRTAIYENLIPSADVKSCTCLTTSDRDGCQLNSLSNMLLMGISPSRMEAGEAERPLLFGGSASQQLLGRNHDDRGLRQTRSLRNLGEEDHDYCNLETDGTETETPPLPPKTRHSAPAEPQARSQKPPAARHHRDRQSAGPVTVLLSPPTPEGRRPASGIVGGGGGGEGGGGGQGNLGHAGSFPTAGSCPGQLGRPPSESNLQPEEDEWTE